MISSSTRFGRLTLSTLLSLSLLPLLASESQAQRRRGRKKAAAASSRKRRTPPRPVGVIVGDRDAGDVVTGGPAGGTDVAAPVGQRRSVTGGILNGRAVSKPQPPYPAIARAARASGQVTVQVTVDETGRVISASAVSGHPLLRQSAESAARKARFTPTLLEGQPVKVTGVITYNFVLQ